MLSKVSAGGTSRTYFSKLEIESNAASRDCCILDTGRRVLSPADVCSIETNGNGIPILE
jgi:hypothetical protein